MTDTTNKNKNGFRAILSPNNSLSPRGFMFLMAGVGLVSFSAGIMFTLMGAWPVFGFFGLDVLLLYWAFKHNFRYGTQREFIEITEREVIILQHHWKKPQQEYRFNKQWVRLELIEDKARELIGALNLCAHGKKIEIGAFLGPDERKEFFQVFQKALDQVMF